MKKVSLFLLSVLTVLMTMLSAVAFAAPSDENPYKNHYLKEAQAMRKQGTAKLVYLFMTREKQPLPGVTMIYNTTKGQDLEAVSDDKGMVEFDLKQSDLYYSHHVVYNGDYLPVSGGAMINNIEKLDIRKGTVLWSCIVQYGKYSFMSYRGN